MASLIDRMFGSGARHANVPGAPAVQAAPNPGQIPNGSGFPAAGTETTAANGTNPTNGPGSAGGNADASKSPFADFEKLWEPVTGPDGKPVQVTSDPLYTVDPNKVLEAAKRTDFKSGITREQMEVMLKGGQEGLAAMMDAMQNMSQLAYANAAVAATKIAEQGITKALSQAETRLPGMIRDQQVRESLATKNPALNDPAVKPIVDMVRNQFIQKNPTATAEEIQSSVDKYMLEVGSAFNPTLRNQQAADLKVQQAAGSEWDVFFNEPSQ